MLKYIEPMVWYQNEQLKDPFKNQWKFRVKRKKDRVVAGFGNIGNFDLGEVKHSNSSKDGKNKTTTTFFVPSTENSRLLWMIKQADQEAAIDMDWNIKVLERAGTPLINCFIKKFGISEGCPRGTMCIVCENDALMCSPRSVVYLASCVKCKNDMNAQTETVMADSIKVSDMRVGSSNCAQSMGMDSYIGNAPTRMKNFQHVGETSRPLRERVAEHVENLKYWKKESFWVEHWLTEHGLDIECPEFKFEVVAAYTDPLRRQLAEGLLILEKGDLNRRCEYNNNFICRLGPAQSLRD